MIQLNKFVILCERTKFMKEIEIGKNQSKMR